MVNQIYSGTLDRTLSKRELAHRRFARRAAAEGMVLMKNEGMLPLNIEEPIALFGGGAVRTIKGGTGSGDVNNRGSSSIYQGIKDAGAQITSGNWLEDYERCYEDARMVWKERILRAAQRVANPFDAYAANPFALPEGRRITEEDLEGASAAVYVISRISGEGKDRRKEEGDYYLSGREREDLLFLNRRGIPVALVLNVGAPIELTDILEDVGNIRAVLNISLPGQEGGYAAADVLFGRAVPGGRLTASWARRYEDYPSAESFGYLNGNLETEEYREGIYVGYRYFDSFGKKPLFPFGFGLSYTSFSMKFADIKRTGTGFDLTIFVKNTGELFPGREVVQVYALPPQTGSTKEFKRLIGFAKTESLKPQESQKLVISVDQSFLASYSEQLHAWYIEAGSYDIWIGEHAESLRPAVRLTIREQAVLEETKAVCSPDAALVEICADETVRNIREEWKKRAEREKIPEVIFEPYKAEKNTCESDRKDGGWVRQIPQGTEKATYQDPLAESAAVTELIPLLYGNITQGASTLGSAGIRVPGSAGETTEALEETYGIRSLIMADGPAGLRLRQSYEADRETGAVYGIGVLGSLENGFLEETGHHDNADTYYQFCTAFPVGTAFAQSWDVELMWEFGRAVAAEMEEFHVDLWLAPGMNIHRNPLCGRNFEYYSEDPMLAGMMAAAVTEGVQSRKGCGVTGKHFACNNQEDNRMGVNVRVSERALREIYLRGFEIAVKKSRPMALMSAYNLVNGVHAANSRELCTKVAREEWGFEGIILSDWNTTVPEDGSIPWQCAAAGNDIIMPGNPMDDEDIRKAYEEGKLSEETIRQSAGRVIGVIRRLSE